ncbi:MAG: glutamate-5-semialdehyde dehydrogenase [Bacteroidia bacterium]|nr:glutamate-5-semialdehyde dehydrogenase [Bacteroidia bacterium]
MTSIIPLLQQVQMAAPSIRRLSDVQKQNLLLDISSRLLENEALILVENEKDLVRMAEDDPKKDRLRLNSDRIRGLVSSLHEVAALPDPSGKLISEKILDNGLSVQKMAVPIGVVGIIYESRPNVTVDVAALCIRSGNAIVLRGGSDAEFSNKALVKIIHEAMQASNVDTRALCLLPTDRVFVEELLTADRYVDIIIPRGSQALIDFVRENATVPTIETGAGVCHTYVAASADLQKAAEVVVNAKVSRPSVCNALDTVVVDRDIAKTFLPMLKSGLSVWSVEIFADGESYEIFSEAGYPYLQKARPEDFGREFLDYKCSVKVVENMDEALSHIRTYSSRHSEAILSEDVAECERFLQEVDAAAVYANASTRFTDGGVFGLGAEIGISTQKLHARGPFALEKLVTEKWIVRGAGQVR